MPTGQRLRVGLLGVGRRARGHLSALQGLKDYYELVAVCDASQARACSAQSAKVRVYTDVREFFSKEALDIVDIATPADTHHLMARVAAEHGVHMLIETPLAPTRPLMDSIIEIAETNKVQVEVGENMWRQPQSQLNRRALDAGLIGKVLRLSSFYEPIGQDGCYHSMSLLQFYAGSQVEEVRGLSKQFEITPVKSYSTSYKKEEWVQGVLFFSNGVVGTCTYLSSWLTPLRLGHPHLLTIEGSEGFIAGGRNVPNKLYRMEAGEQKAYPLHMDTTSVGGQDVPGRFYYDTTPLVEYMNPFGTAPIHYNDGWGMADVLAIANELVSIHRSVTKQTSPEYGCTKARSDQELSIAIQESARSGGQPVRLPLKETTQWEIERHEELRTKWGWDPLKNADRLTQ